MPAGLTWPRYLVLMGTSLGSMLSGAAVVHYFFQPDLTVPDAAIPPPAPVREQPAIQIVAGPSRAKRVTNVQSKESS
eukprot:m.61239 g.61239  ORF g.61239 m.61239 type:complete len:77 (-) comp19258_c0_seq4:96-326(-)